MTNGLHNQTGGSTSLFRAWVFLSACVWASNVCAQETRADVLAQERAAKAQQADTAVPAEPGRLERTFKWVEAKIEGSSGTTRDGFYPELGGMITGAGISVGPGYRRHLLGDRAVIKASAAISWRQSRIVQSQIEWPRLFTDRLSVGAQVKYQDFTQVNFFGIGGDSLKANQTDYRLKDVDALGFATVRANRWLSAGGRVGVLRNAGIERGTSSLHPSTGDRFDEASAPGLMRQPRLLHADLFVDADRRDAPGHPTRGGEYRLSVSTFHDQDFSHYSFRRVEVDAAQYVPLLHKSWVLALRGRVALSQTDAGQEVPFYLLPTLGGPSTLRGFLDYRFRDRNLVLLNAEYRWPIFRALDGALFYDAGTVASTPGALSMRHPNTDYGLGFRLHSTTRTLFRFDVGRGREGTHAFVSFTAPLRVPTRTVVPYVP